MSARLVDAIYNPQEVNAGASPVLNLNYGGQFGVMPRFGHLDSKNGKFYGEWINSAPYIRENMIPILMAYPKFIDLLPNSERWIGIFKNLMENIPQSIDGIRMTLSVEYDSTPTGAQEQFEAPTRVVRERSEPNYTYKERKAMPITKTIDFWIKVGIMDPDTQQPGIIKFLKDNTSNEEFGMYTPEFYTATVLYVEPDNLNTTILKAALVVNMFPKASGPMEMVRNLANAKEGSEFSVGYTGMTISTPAVQKLAKSLLGRMTSLYETPDIAETIPVGDIHPNVRDNQVANSFDKPQGNGDMAYDPYPNA